jgi:hypothetical protein
MARQVISKFVDLTTADDISLNIGGGCMKKSIETSTLLGAACLALMPVTTAYAANWVYVTNSRGAYFYYDSATIQRSGNRVVVWEKADYSRNKSVKLLEMKARYRYDCAERTSTLLQATGYHRDGKIETVTWKANQQIAAAVIPDTSEETMLEAVCR